MAEPKSAPQGYKPSLIGKDFHKILTQSGLPSKYQSIATSVTPERYTYILQEADAGRNEEFLTLAGEMEERDPHYYAVSQSRKMGILGLTKTVESVTDSRRDRKIAEECEALTREQCFEQMLFNAADADFRGYAASEIDWGIKDGRCWPMGYTYCDPRLLVYDQTSHQRLRLRVPDSEDTLALPPGKFIVHTAPLRGGNFYRGGLARVCGGVYVAKAYVIRDMLAFLEKYGMPFLLGKVPDGSGDSIKLDVQDAIIRAGQEFGVVVEASNGLEVLNAMSGSSNGAVFLQVLEYLDKQMSKAVVSQTMTVDDGSSLAQAQVHKENAMETFAGSGRNLSATIDRDLFAPYVALNYGPNVSVPRFRMLAPEKRNMKEIVECFEKLAKVGFRTEGSVLGDLITIPFVPAGEIDDELLVGAPSEPEEQVMTTPAEEAVPYAS